MEPDKPARKPIRLKAYDYAQNGAYFVTICTQERKNFLWDVGATTGRPQGEFVLSRIGIIAERLIHRISEFYPRVTVEKYVVMPNHVHMIIVISNPGMGGRPVDAPTVPHIIQQYKGAVTKETGFPVWQKSFYDHIIRSEQEYAEVWQYIDTNPLKMQEDPYTL
jgi:REP element-mobilizing transposase RayT